MDGDYSGGESLEAMVRDSESARLQAIMDAAAKTVAERQAEADALQQQQDEAAQQIADQALESAREIRREQEATVVAEYVGGPESASMGGRVSDDYDDVVCDDDDAAGDGDGDVQRATAELPPPGPGVSAFFKKCQFAFSAVNCHFSPLQVCFVR